MTAEEEREALAHAEEAASVKASAVLYVPRSAPVAPCPFPCSICREKGRQ